MKAVREGMAKLLSRSPLTFSKREYQVDVWDNDVMVVFRQGSAVAVANRQDGTWSLCGGRETIFRAAVRVLDGVVFEG